MVVGSLGGFLYGQAVWFGFPNSLGEGGGLDFILGDGYSGLATEDVYVAVD